MSEPDRQVKITLVIDEKGAVRAMRTTGDEGEHADRKLGKLDKSVKGLGKSFGGLKSLIGYGLGAAGLGGLAFGLKDIVSATGELAEETHKFHSITGMGEQSSLDYTAALKARGIGAEAGGNAFKFLAKNIQLAERQEHTYGLAQEKASAKHKIATGLLGVQATAFKLLGIDLTQFSHLSEQAKFETIIKKFEGMKDGAEKTRLALQIFGRGGTALLPVLDKGALGLSHFDQMAKRFFPTLKGGAHELEELQEKQSESKMAWEGLEFTLGVKLIPAITETEAWFSKLVVSVEQGHGVWGTLEEDGAFVVDSLKSVVHWFEGSQTAVVALEGVLGFLGAAWGVEKVVSFGKAVKSLALVRGITKLLGYGGLATAAEEAGTGTAAGLAALAPEILAVTAAVGLVYEGVKHAEEIREFFGIGKTLTVHKKGPPTLTPAEQRRSEQLFLRDPHILSSELDLAHQRHEEIAPAALNALATIKADLHLDSVKVAEAFLHNPHAARLVTEAVARHAKKQQARK